MKLAERIFDRVVKHWKSTLFGLSYAAVFIMMYTHKLTHAEAIGTLTALLTFKGIFFNKDADKTEDKPQ